MAASTRGKEVALTLYRNILRAHKQYLPEDMKVLGDAYVKSEFKLFKSVTNEGQLDEFYTAWNQYLDQILLTARTKQSVSAGSLESSENLSLSFGKHLPTDVELSDEQKEQLHKLREETSKAGGPPPNTNGF
mmetsp:Transcript_22368/g.36101  ORF Transcript_22368/g.36101 Transcript_22368/m.36101 type:complete len:132 (-) Transcript_22368:43-438(-)